jgi:hypothetical protein
VAGHAGFELRNVAANYPFERSRRFPGLQPNSGHRDHSRLSCGSGKTQLGPGASIRRASSRTRWSSICIAEMTRKLAAISADPKMILQRQNQQQHCSVCARTLRAKRACVVTTDGEPDRLAPLTPPAPMGLRRVGWWRRTIAPAPPARCCAGMRERSFACPSAKLRALVRRGLHPRSVRRRPAAVSTRGERIQNRRGCLHCYAGRAAPRLLVEFDVADSGIGRWRSSRRNCFRISPRPILDRASLRRHWAGPCHRAQARAHDAAT